MEKYIKYSKNFDDTDAWDIDDATNYLNGYTLNSNINFVLNNPFYKSIHDFIISNKEQIKVICDDIDHNIYTFIDNNVYINGNKLDIEPIIDMIFIDRLSIVGITIDNRVIKIFGGEVTDRLLNNNIPYKKIITSDGEIMCLTNDGYLVFQIYDPTSFDSRLLIDVDDIKMGDDYSFYIEKENTLYKL